MEENEHIEEKNHEHEVHEQENPVHKPAQHEAVHHAHPAVNHSVKVKLANKIKKIKNERNILFATTLIFLILFIGALVFSPGAQPLTGNETNMSMTTPTGFVITLLNDERCPDCDTTMLKGSLVEVFPDAEFIELDYAEDNAKELMANEGITLLPAVLFTNDVKTHENYAQISQFIVEGGNYLNLAIGASFDPNGEICTNEVDDNGDGLVDCADPDCSSEWFCALEKTDKPKIELFVMSHCPYGTQIEKGILPVIDLLGDKVEFELKFCDYAMHSEPELNEQLSQVCIQENYPDKLIEYLYCFLEAGDGEGCVDKLEFDQDTLGTCVAAKDVEFAVSEGFADKTTWSGGRFPKFNVFADDVAKYSVGGSPTFVLNGVSVPTGRSPAVLLNAICMGFSDQPDECQESLDTLTPSPGFGFTEGSAAANAAAQCS